MNITASGQIEAAAAAGAIGQDPALLCVAYLINQYPKISHAFIRREILGLENCGVRVERFSLRLCRDKFVDEADLAELRKTRVVLESGLLQLAYGCAAAMVTRPIRFARALRLALRMGRDSDRGVFVHMAYLVEACTLLRWFLQRRVDHVHAHFATNPAAVAMLCRELGGPPYSFTAHGPDDFERARFLGLEEKISRARFVMTVSSYGLDQLQAWCGREHWPRLYVLHPGIDDGFLRMLPVPLPAAPRLICIGRLDEEKGQLLLVEAISRIINDGIPCELLLIGDGPLRARIATRIGELRLEGVVVVAGAVPTSELCAGIQRSRALVVSSLAENLPSVILEAFALQRPVIATMVGGIPELVKPGINGWLVPPGSVEGLERGIRELLSADAETLDRMGREGASCVKQQFRSQDAARQLLARFQDQGGD